MFIYPNSVRTFENVEDAMVFPFNNQGSATRITLLRLHVLRLGLKKSKVLVKGFDENHTHCH